MRTREDANEIRTRYRFSFLSLEGEELPVELTRLVWQAPGAQNAAEPEKTASARHAAEAEKAAGAQNAAEAKKDASAQNSARCEITFEAEGSLVAAWLADERFHLLADLADTEPTFESDEPVVIRARLRQSYARWIADSGGDSETVLAALLPEATEHAFLRQSECWLALELMQQIPLPEALADEGAVQHGMQTAWLKLEKAMAQAAADSAESASSTSAKSPADSSSSPEAAGSADAVGSPGPANRTGAAESAPADNSAAFAPQPDRTLHADQPRSDDAVGEASAPSSAPSGDASRSEPQTMRLERLLQQLNLRYEVFAPDVVRLDLRTEIGSWRMLVHISESDWCSVYSVFPELVPTSAHAAVAVQLMNLNYDGPGGAFELDAGDGELRFRTSIPGAGSLSAATLADVLAEHRRIMERYLPQAGDWSKLS